jgi:hypothetical protein
MAPVVGRPRRLPAAPDRHPAEPRRAARGSRRRRRGSPRGAVRRPRGQQRVAGPHARPAAATQRHPAVGARSRDGGAAALHRRQDVHDALPLGLRRAAGLGAGRWCLCGAASAAGHRAGPARPARATAGGDGRPVALGNPGEARPDLPAQPLRLPARVSDGGPGSPRGAGALAPARGHPPTRWPACVLHSAAARWPARCSSPWGRCSPRCSPSS